MPAGRPAPSPALAANPLVNGQAMRMGGAPRRDDDRPTSWQQFWPQAIDPLTNGKAGEMPRTPAASTLAHQLVCPLGRPHRLTSIDKYRLERDSIAMAIGKQGAKTWASFQR